MVISQSRGLALDIVVPVIIAAILDWRILMNAISRIAISVSVLLGASGLSFAQETVRHVVDSRGREVIVTTGMPASQHYGPKPAFAELDRDHDGSISRQEAEAFPPLLNDFDFLSRNTGRISARQYAQWDYR